MVSKGSSLLPSPGNLPTADPVRLKADDLRRLCLQAGAGAAGFVDIGRPALDAERSDILAAYPRTRSIISLAFPLNPENIRSAARQMSSDEVHYTSGELATVAHLILRRLNGLGARGVIAPADFPMDMGRFPGKIWYVSHKVMAVEGGLGHMGLNRLVIHPELGNFIRLTSLLIDAELDEYDAPLEKTPCNRCGLCVAVCPVGAISATEPFNLVTCMTHAYRDNVVGFMDLLDSLLVSKDMEALRERFKDREIASMWQSLMYKMNYRCGYCMAVCAAGRTGGFGYEGKNSLFKKEIFQPLKNRKEDVYVIAGSAAEQRALGNPNKQVRRVGLSVARKP